MRNKLVRQCPLLTLGFSLWKLPGCSIMDGKELTSELQEVMCPICMEILKDPVTIDCGHNFCLQCISDVEKTADTLLCPLCKASVNRSTFRPNKLLASLVERVQAKEAEEAELRCPRHRQKLNYFSEEDGKLLCLVCRDSKDHKSHTVTPLEEAVQSYQEQIEAQLKVLEPEKKIVKEKPEDRLGVFKAQVHLERLKIREEFKDLRKSLEEEESFLLARLRGLQEEGDKCAEQLGSLKEITASLKAKQQMPPRQLLQDIKVTLSRSQQFQFTNPVPEDLEDRINEARSRHESTIESMKKFIENLRADGKKDKSGALEKKKRKKKKKPKRPLDSRKEEDMENAPVTLNAASADPDLTLSQDLKKVSLNLVSGGAGIKRAKPRPFDPYHCVWGSQGLSSGLQVWEAELQGTEGGDCVVGVATEVVPGLLSKDQLWALRISASGCQPITSSSTQQNIPILLSEVGVFLDRDGGKVIFFEPTTNKHIYTFQASFTGQVFPVLGLLNPGSHITLSP